MLRSSAWQRALPNVYAEAVYAQGADPFLLRCRAAAVWMPPGAVLSGRAAACMGGVRMGDPTDAVLVLAAPGTCSRRVPGLTVRHVVLPDHDVDRSGCCPVTTPLRTAREIAAVGPLIEAVADIDQLLHCGYVDPGPVVKYVRAHPRSRAARVFRLADERSESPQESRLRVRLRLAGLPAPVPQYAVRLDGRMRRLDFAWPEAMVALEYDGIHHTGYAQMAADRARLNALIKAGWTVLHATAPQLADPALFQRLVDQLRSLLG
jgi:very-short-patch-repair endonuclease